MSVPEPRESPRDALARDPDAFLADGLANLRDALVDLRSVLEIPEDLDVVEWAEEHFYLSAETTGSTEKVRLYGYQKAILRAMADPSIEILVIPKSTRTGLTQLCMIDAAYEIGHRHNQVMVIQPTDLKAQEFSNDYLQPAFRDSPLLSEQVRRPKKGERQNTWCDIQYLGGGSCRLGWASSDDTFRGRTAGKMYPDEVDADAWEATAKSQGEKLDMLLDRGETRAGSKMVVTSSPTRKKGSRIWPLWERSDQQHYFMPCPDCGHMQRLQWGGRDTRYGIKPLRDAEGNFTEAVYMCEACEFLIPDDKSIREEMDARGEYRAQTSAKRRRLQGMHISALYSLAPNMSWTKLWELWEEAQGSPQKLKVFYNTKLGLPWEDTVTQQQADPTAFGLSRPRPYRAEVPAWAEYLTMATDTQEGHHDPDRKDYLPPRHEVEVRAWGPQEESALVYYGVIPATTPFDREATEALDAVMKREWVREDKRRMTVLVHAVDCSYLMDEAITYCQATPRAHLCVPVRGQREFTVELAPPVMSKPGVHQATGRQFTLLGTRALKNIAIRRLLEIEEPGPGFCHFPASLAAAMPKGHDYFKGLFAERAETDLKGILHWERIEKSNTGEPWDLLVYNLAAIRIAVAKYPQVARFMRDARMRDVDEPFDGVDRSAMAAVLERKLVTAGTGGYPEPAPAMPGPPHPRDYQGYDEPYVPQVRTPVVTRWGGGRGGAVFRR